MKGSRSPRTRKPSIGRLPRTPSKEGMAGGTRGGRRGFRCRADGRSARARRRIPQHLPRRPFMPTSPVTFPGSEGGDLSARLELPADAKPTSWALFAHCFTCTKNVRAAVDHRSPRRPRARPAPHRSVGREDRARWQGRGSHRGTPLHGEEAVPGRPAEPARARWWRASTPHSSSCTHPWTRSWASTMRPASTTWLDCGCGPRRRRPARTSSPRAGNQLPLV